MVTNLFQMSKSAAVWNTAFLLLFCGIEVARSQSNYASQANNVEYIGEGLPENALLDGKVRNIFFADENLIVVINGNMFPIKVCAD